MKLGKMIRNYRETRGIEQDTLAAQIGIGVTVLSRIESGQRSPSWETLQKIINWLLK